MKRLSTAAFLALFALTVVLAVAGPAAAASNRCGEKKEHGGNSQSCYPPGQQGNGPGNNGNGHGNEAKPSPSPKADKSKPASAFEPYGDGGITVGMLLGVLVGFGLLSGLVRWRLAKWLR